MIRYALKCPDGHSFESWFQSADAYDALADRGLVTCAVCGAGGVAKAMMAPRVSAETRKAVPAPMPVPAEDAPATPAAPAPGPVQAAAGPIPPKMAEALRAYRTFVETHTQDVGRRFAQEARAMHLGDKEDRPIRGEASAEEARSLLEDGVPILPVPGVPKTKRN